jgi:hypothetical protein
MHGGTLQGQNTGGLVMAPQHPAGIPPGHMPQKIAFPQPSLAGPMQNATLPKTASQSIGMHVGDAHALHWPGVPPAPHTSFAGHAPQSRVLPQPALAGPHMKPRSEQLFGTHGLPHTLGVPPPPQVAGGVQFPQSMVLPQPGPPQRLVASPQSNPCEAHVAGLHSPTPHLFGGPFSPHTMHGGQPPQSSL